MPGTRFAIVVLVPVPVIFPGLIVHVPVAGRPFSTTLPVGDAHADGCVMIPAMGAVGAGGGALIITSAEGFDIHPAAAVTLKLYVPGIRFEMVVLVPVPVIAPGLIVHVPVEGRPLSTTLPVVAAHEAGWVIVPTTGAVGAAGGSFITTSADAFDIHPGSLQIVKLYVPGARLSIVVLVP